MSDSVIVDSWTCYGPGPEKDAQERWTLKHLLEDMDFNGLPGALVRHRQMFCYDAMHVNYRLLAEIKPHRNRLLPVWAVQPHQAGDFPSPSELCRRMSNENIKAVFIQPALQGYPVHGDILKPLAEVLNAERSLILTTLSELGNNYTEVLNFCRLFADCPILLGEASWSQWRLVSAIMEVCPNVHLELHLLQGNRAVECLARRYGIGRLLFGSGLTKHSAGAARGFVDWSLLSPSELNQFTGRNLLRLLGLNLPFQSSMPAAADQFVQSAAAGKPLPGPVMDAHCHVLDDGLQGAGARYVMPRGDAAGILELTRRTGIKKTAMMSWNGSVGMDVSAGNSLIEKIVANYPREVIGVSSCDPTHQNPQEIEAMCRRLHLEKGFGGMKPYHRNGLSYADAGYDSYWKFGEAHSLYALLHVHPAAGGLEAIRKLAEHYPGLTILIAHAGGSWSFARQVADLVKEYSNIMAELTLTSVPNGIIEWLCREVGADRVLFGTDAPMRDPRPQLGWCVYTRLFEDDKKKVLGGNFARVLKLGQ